MLHNEKIQKTISTFIESQLPLYLELHYNKFAGTNISKMGRFIQLYYEWLEKSYPATISDLSKSSINSYSDFMVSHLRPEDGNVWDTLIRLESFRDVDNTKETLLRYIRSEFNPDLPFDIKADKRKLVKRMKELNRTRGTVPAFESYFSLVYNKNPKVVMKQDHVFTTNANEWSKRSVIRVLQGGTLSGDDMAGFKGYYMVGQSSGAKAVVAGVEAVSIGNVVYRELEIDKETQTGTFSAGEILMAETEGGLSVNKTGTDEQLKATVQNSFQGVTFTDASTGGSGYYLDDVVTLGTVTDSLAKIKKLTRGQIEGIKVTSGTDNSVINFVNDYFAVYGLEGNFTVGKEIVGLESGARGVLRFKDVSGGQTKYWIDNISGTFRTDQVKGGEYSSEELTHGEVTALTKLTNGSGYSTTTGLTTKESGTGIGLKVNVTLSGNAINAISINTAGTGYKVGDIIEIEGGTVNATAEVTGVSTEKMRADQVIRVCEVTASAESTTGTKSNLISPGVGYTSLPKLYISNLATDSIQPYGTDIGGIEEIEIVKFGLASGSSSVTFRDTSTGSSGHIRATGTVTYGAEITYGGEDTLFKSNPSEREARVTDADFFTWYSYVVSASEPPEVWKEQLKRFTHPAGMKIYADYLIDTEKTLTTTTSTKVVTVAP